MDPTSKSIKELKREYLAARTGYRSRQYSLLANVMSAVVALREDNGKLESFLALSKARRPKIAATTRWITIAVVAYVSGSKRKLASKRARVLEYLFDFKNVPIEQMAEQLGRLGGIEAVNKLARQEDPRPMRSDSHGNEGEEEERSVDTETEDVSEPEQSILKKSTLDIRIKASSRKVLRRIKVGSKVSAAGVLFKRTADIRE